MRVAVVGHVEWVDFVRVERLPAPGEIVHAIDAWAEPAGGGGVAAVVLAALAGECTLFTALGDDELGRRSAAELGGHGVRVEAAVRPEPQRRAVTHVDDTGERTITLLSHKLVPRKDDPLPWAELAEYDAVYFTGGDPAALRAARVARSLVATARELTTLVEAEVQLDALVRSGRDPGETYEEGWLDPPPRIAVATEGSEGGLVTEGGDVRRYAAADATRAGIRHVRRRRFVRRRAHVRARRRALPPGDPRPRGPVRRARPHPPRRVRRGTRTPGWCVSVALWRKMGYSGAKWRAEE